MSEKKTQTSTRAKRTPIEIFTEKSNKFVRNLQTTLKQSEELRNRINLLPSKEFSQNAIAFNNIISEAKATLEKLPFETTDKPEDVEVTKETTKTFSDYVKE